MLFDIEMDSIPESVAEKFGDPQARPRVMRAYDPKAGWLDISSKTILTFRTAAALRQDGKTLVVVKWKRQLHQVSLLRLQIPVS